MGIKRAKRCRWVLGVCGGVARHFGWDSNAVRLVAVILAILSSLARVSGQRSWTMSSLATFYR